MTATLIEPMLLEPPADTLITGADLLLHPEWGPCELVGGRVIPVCRPNNTHGYLVSKINIRLGTFIEKNNLGILFSGASGIYLGRDPDTVRGPDLHFVSAERWPGESAWSGYLEIPPDLCIEIVSPNDNWTDLEDKVDQYFDAGVKLVWIIDPKMRKARVRRLRGPETLIPSTGTLTGENILPGFELRLDDLFDALNAKK
jgi:Uma2 family endonuclease